MVKRCWTGLLKLNFEIIQKTHFLVFAKNFRRLWMKLKIFLCQFPNPWTLRVPGMACFTSKCEKSQNHSFCALRQFFESQLTCIYFFNGFWSWNILIYVVDVLPAASTSAEAKQEVDEDKEGRPSTYNNKRFKILHLPTDMFDLILFGYPNEEGHITKADAFRKK